MHLRQEAKFDRRQREHRKWVVSYLLQGDPYWTIAAILALLAAAALFAFFESHH
jgi:tryptophan synthase alpha subunit